MRTYLVALFVLLSSVNCFASSLPSADDRVLLTLRLAKAAGYTDNIPVAIHFPANCKACERVEDPAYERQNGREIILAVRVPRSTQLEVEIVGEPAAIRRVLLESTDLSFTLTRGGIRFTLPSQVTNRINSGEFQTHLYWPGVELRYEHADLERRAGAYAKGDFPVLEREAAGNLEFGLLEAIRELGIDRYVDNENLGRLFLMGFDTNYPHGHLDSPPHFHLALWWPNYRATGTLIPHMYITPQGLLSHSLTAMFGWPGQPTGIDFKPGQPMTPVDMLGRPVYSLVITDKGWLRIARPDGAECVLQPLGEGFQAGVSVACPGFSDLRIRVQDDTNSGKLSETINGSTVRTYRYDLDNGDLLP